MYLDPVFAETRSQTDRVKQSIVLSQQMEIQNNLDTLQKVPKLIEDFLKKCISLSRTKSLEVFDNDPKWLNRFIKNL